MLSPLTAFSPIVETNGVLTQESRIFFDILYALVADYEAKAALIPTSGTGSPEGVLAAPVGATYYDLGAVAGSRTYLKIATDVGGDITQGWELQ